MRYYRKSNYRRTLYTPTPPKAHSFDIYEYLRKDFFNSDEETFRKIAKFYKTHYGENAYTYLLNTYSLWKVGKVSISSLTMRRIIECVPKFLSPEKRLYILRCEIYNFIEKSKEKLKKIDLKTSNLHLIFETLQKEIINFNQDNLHWFIGKNIFPIEQIEHYLSVCKYTLNERLIQSYRQSINDLNIISDKFNSFIYEINSAIYKIDFLNLSFDIQQIEKYKLSYVPLNSLTLNLERSFAKFGEKYILDELMKMNFYEIEGEVNASIKSKDIDTVFTHYIELTKTKNEIMMTSKFQGEGGLLTMKLEFIPFKKSVESALISALKIIAIVFFLTLVTFLIIRFELYWIFILLLFGGFILVFELMRMIPKEILILRKSITHIKQNGKQQPTFKVRLQ